jgi:hypothetical protein
VKYFFLNQRVDETTGTVVYDTSVAIYYSKDNQFEWVRELCPINDGGFEGIKYKGKFMGRLLYSYCNSNSIKEELYKFNGSEAGPVTLYEENGQVFTRVDMKNATLLYKLRDIKYAH